MGYCVANINSSVFFFFCLFIPAFDYLRTFRFSFSLSVDATRVRGHYAGTSPPSPLQRAPSFFSPEGPGYKFFPRRVAPNRCTRKNTYIKPVFERVTQSLART